MHSLIVGTTESGKTTLAKILCIGLKKEKKKCAVLDPLNDDGWECEFQTGDSEQFLAWAKDARNKGAYLFVDEGSVSVGRYDVPMQWIATQSRHWGHSAFFIVQSATQIAPVIRSCCSRLFIFATTEKSMRLCAEEFNEPTLSQRTRLPQGHFYIVSRFQPIQNFALDFKKRSVRLVSTSE